MWSLHNSIIIIVKNNDDILFKNRNYMLYLRLFIVVYHSDNEAIRKFSLRQFLMHSILMVRLYFNVMNNIHTIMICTYTLCL